MLPTQSSSPLPSSNSEPLPTSYYSYCEWLIELILSIFHTLTCYLFYTPLPLENRIADETRPLCTVQYNVSYQQATYNNIKTNMLRYYAGPIPNYIRLNDQTLSIAFCKTEQDLYTLPEKNGIKPITYRYMVGGIPTLFGIAECCSLRPTFYYASQHDHYPPRYLRMLQRLMPRTHEELNAIVRDFKALRCDRIKGRWWPGWQGFQIKHSIFGYANRSKILQSALLIYRLQAYYLFHDESSAVLEQIRTALIHHQVGNIDDTIARITTPPDDRGHHYWSYQGYLPFLEILIEAPDIDLGEAGRNPEALMKQLYTTVQANAHGIKAGNGGVFNLINIMLEGLLRPNVYTGPLSGGPPDYNTRLDVYSGQHGPYYVILGNNNEPTAYIVPFDEDKWMVHESLNTAQKRGMLTEQEKNDLMGKLYTIPEYIKACAR